MLVPLHRITNTPGQSSLINLQFHLKTVSADQTVQCSQIPITADLLLGLMFMGIGTNSLSLPTIAIEIMCGPSRKNIKSVVAREHCIGVTGVLTFSVCV
ncbi:hypothetical protein F0562_000360 [Nyssa sinensis]|uniref:Uncharacterized protein n=1 Tax=Nyssa sinensis TaxID=561372 RepID=A0A5J5C194_9ASTE|nr:hypothetical protein F0562_000360 [Nyssa sinensis]